MNTKKSYGQIAFEAHFSQGDVSWERASAVVRNAWEETARAVISTLSDDLLPNTAEVHVHVHSNPIPVLARLGLPRTAEGA